MVATFWGVSRGYYLGGIRGIVLGYVALSPRQPLSGSKIRSGDFKEEKRVLD